mgnify:FL=1|jgi:hypothetical protein
MTFSPNLPEFNDFIAHVRGRYIKIIGRKSEDILI